MHAGSDALRRPPDASCASEGDVVRRHVLCGGIRYSTNVRVESGRVVAAHTPESLPDVMIHALAA